MRIAGLRARLGIETNELAQIRDRGTNLVRLEVDISKLERDEAMEVQRLNHIEQTMQNAAIASDLGPGKVSNISTAEQPTPPAPNLKKTQKIIAGLAAGGVALGLGLAFVLEMVLDRSFKRPQEVVSKLSLPFFLSVPYLNGHAKLRLPKPSQEVKLLPEGAEERFGVPPSGGTAAAAPNGGVGEDQFGVPPSGGSATAAPNGGVGEDQFGVPPLGGSATAAPNGGVGEDQFGVPPSGGSATAAPNGGVGEDQFGVPPSGGSATAAPNGGVGEDQFGVPPSGGSATAAPNGGVGEDQFGVPPLGGSATSAPNGGALAPARQGLFVPGDENPVWRPFHETLRDRLIAYFEMLNLTHKPKLVALTSCHRGAGVSTLATGLASLLSETGDGNVLLVNMNSEEGDAHQFYKGKPNLGLDDLFEKEQANREHALVQENLYVIRESSNRDKLPAILPKRFSHLVTKMKASDYDYIIFDMPPVTQISVTPRLARFMDMVLLVVESEKTDRDVAQRAASLLTESRAHVGVVMNKNRTYVPRRLHQEL